MDVVDFKVDRASLRGQAVELSGLVMPFGEFMLLAADVGDLSPIFVAVAALPRDQRRALAACSAACPATVRGRGDTVMMQPGLKAESLVLR